MARNYSNTATATTLSGGINAAVTTMVVGTVAGLPATFPYAVIVDYQAASQEVVLVTAAAGTTLTITRGYDGTSAQSHSAGAAVVHGVIAKDLSDPQAHIDATTNIHGLSGGAQLVGTSTTQTLTNKTISGSDNTFSNIPGSAIVGEVGSGTTTTFEATVSLETPVLGVNVDPTTMTNKNLEVHQSSTSNVPLTVSTEVASPSANAFEVKNSSGTTTVRAKADGTLSAAGDVVAGGTAPLASARLSSTAGNTSQVPLVGQGASGQTGALLELRNSAGTVLFRVNSDGAISTAGHGVHTATGTNIALTARGNGQDIARFLDAGGNLVGVVRSDGSTSFENPRGMITGSNSCGNNAFVTISGGTADFDSTGDMTFSNRLEAPRSGIYQYNAIASYENTSGAGYRRCIVRRNGTTLDQAANFPSSFLAPACVSNLVELDAGDEIDIQLQQNSGNTVTCNWKLSMHWIGDA